MDSEEQNQASFSSSNNSQASPVPDRSSPTPDDVPIDSVASTSTVPSKRAATPSEASHAVEPETTEKSIPKKKKSKATGSGTPVRPPAPLPALPSTTPLPDLEDFNLKTEQLRNPLFVAISKVLIVYGNAWQSATDLVDGIRHFNLANLGGRTPKGTVQGAISTALALSAALKTFEPIEKQRMNSTTYYRMDARALEPAGDVDSDASNSVKSKVVTNARRKPKQIGGAEEPKLSDGPKPKKRKLLESWDSDTMSSGTSDDDYDMPVSKRGRAGSPGSSSRRKPAVKEVPNGLKKLPKGYVYDTDINQSALMNLSINPSQTGEFMEHLKGQRALENDYPDRRSEYGVDLTHEPSMFAVEQQIGYRYPRLRTGRERLPKTDCEDGFAVADLKHHDGYLGRLFCITDGHGGRACSSFVIATIPGAMQVILGKYKPSDLSLPNVQQLVKNQITEAIRLIDKEYLDYKKQQYLLYKAKKIPHDPGSDGTTLIVNIFIDKWVICVNVGDSRSILSSRDAIGRWNVDFYSEDHTPSLERLAQTIYANGGEFVTHDDKVIRFDPNFKNDKKNRQSLKEARIRVKDGASNLYGIPYRTRNGQCASVNLGACIGDVLYKLDPVNPVLSCKPDITFIDISKIQHGYLLMASDGLWDYVQRGGKVQDQNSAVCQFVGDKLDRGWNHQRIVCTLSDREGMTGLYSDSIQEYDDFTAILVTINNQHLIEKQQEQQPPIAPKDQQEGVSQQQQQVQQANGEDQHHPQQPQQKQLENGEQKQVENTEQKQLENGKQKQPEPQNEESQSEPQDEESQPEPQDKESQPEPQGEESQPEAPMKADATLEKPLASEETESEESKQLTEQSSGSSAGTETDGTGVASEADGPEAAPETTLTENKVDELTVEPEASPSTDANASS
ncbi:Protein phosphatase 1L [Mortierella polycephala]|uniref:Protein phosphatase 1L n=1 Tax=Mortierella polycephala TaxID=41804 RepID=A0A9P6Q6K6_9FUNG|nr:Protein phosphatase 1L [Mortierella polycephala]